MKVVIAGGGTGGHLMPALALADALSAARPDLEVVLVGAQRGVENLILPKRRYRYHLLPAEPIYRSQWWKNFRWPLIAWRLSRPETARWFAIVTSAEAGKRHGGSWIWKIALWSIVGGVLQAISTFR